MKKKSSFLGFILVIIGLFSNPIFSQIVANNDSGSIINNTGTTVVIQDLLNNDSLNGFPITISQVTIAQISSTSSYFSINPSTGSVLFNGPAPIGNYYLGYEICDANNAGNCAQADIFVSVVPNQIRAVKDYANTPNGSAPVVVIQDVLANDTLNGLPLTLSQVSISQVSSTSNYLSINENGGVVFSNGPAPTGTYTINYYICENANPNNCASGFAAVSIGCTVTTPVATITQPSCFNSLSTIQLSGLPAVGTWNIYSNGVIIKTGSGVVTTLTGITPGKYTINVANATGCFSPPLNIEVGYLTTALTATYVDFNADGITNVGDIITYNIGVTNISSCNLTDVIVNSIGLNVTGNPVSLAAGATDTTTFSATYPLTQNDINTGFVYKTITATGTASSGTVTSASAATTTLNVTDGIKLVAFLDANSNGIKDASEHNFSLGEYHYDINDSGVPTNVASNGDYYLYESNPATSYDLSYTVNSANAAQYTVTNANYNNITVAAGSGITTFYFAVTVVPFKDLEIVVYPYGVSPRPGFTYYNYVSYRNSGNVAIPSGTVSFTKDNLVTILSVSQAGTVSNATGFTYNFSNLLPNEVRGFTVNMQVPVIPIVSIGNLLTNSASITIPVGDINPANNNSSYSQVIVGSYDPNDKSESHGGKVLFSTFTANDYLTYTIRFENTGTANAINVNVSDILDNHLDETTVSMVRSSHPYILERVGSHLTWKFNGIELPPSVEDTNIGHGYIVFQVKPKAGYSLGDIIPNTADIFFDFNPAIVTNTCTTEFVNTLATKGFAFDQFSFYPNPVKNAFHISNDVVMDSMTITSVLGQTILTKNIEASEATIDLSLLSKGIYFVKVKAKNEEKTVKIIKE
ncbi:T9SS type A sorting domain-containing protein [Flavobacterium sp.]|uniref:T9SS type A sorting domain-containing protein n=1 Tax=Flavobacterium sp. TaxID=239 RepID=UPI00286ADCE3|nr:T9SS type A sorting domain-containing protein [Flavobacterium sp.]